MSLIFIVDDDEAVRDSLSMLVESAGHAAETFDLALAALVRCRARRPDCILSDVRMPGMDGIEFQGKLIENGMDAPVVIMTGHGDVGIAVRAMKAGALDFIEKPFDDTAILTSIAEAIEKHASRSVTKPVDAEIAARLERLTAREREVLDLLVSGDPNKVIAYRLQISPRTVEIHRARVMEKMQAKSLPQLVRMAMELGTQDGR